MVSKGIKTSLTYKSEDVLKPGDLVIVEIKNTLHSGIVVAKQDIEITSVKFEIKSITQKLPLPSLSEESIQILQEIAYHQMESTGTIFSIILKNVEVFLKQVKSLEHILKTLKKSSITGGTNLTIENLQDFIELKINIRGFLYSDNTINSKIKLTKIQNEAFSELQNPSNKKIILLEGETGSGKTIVYLEKIKKILLDEPSAQILILLPEIALTNAILVIVEKYLGIKASYWHSTISVKERRENFLAIIFGLSRVIVGARSAIFLPFNNLKLIIIDEEHDSSFKQEQQVLYQTIDVAKIIAKYNQKLIILLCSATPSLKTIYNVKIKNYTRISLKSNKSLQERMRISVEDMNSFDNKKNLISDVIINRIKFYTENHLQSMVFLNKRGYNSVIICKKCNNKLICKNCSIGLLFHKELKKFFCSYCGFSTSSVNTACRNCSTENDFKFYGYGIEKIYEIIQEKFPHLANQNRICLLSSDNNKDLQSKILQIENGEVDIVVGTQILAKGHNFPRLGFLGIIDGGLNFSGIDLHSSEKTYQILHQVVGRLGRFGIKGEVVIQTLESKNLILHALLEQNRIKFYSHELHQRKNFLMPPFSQLFKVTFSHITQQKAENNALKFVNSLEYTPEVEIIGPSPSSIIKVNQMYRYNILIKSSNEVNLQKILYDQFEKNNIKSSSFRIDVSPDNFI